MRKEFERAVSALDEIFLSLEEFIDNERIDPELKFGLNLAIEEIFTNLVKYNRAGTKNIAIEFRREDQDIVICITDTVAVPFDFDKAVQYDTSLPLEKRPVGKLGIHLTKKIVDRIDSELHDNKQTIRLVKHLGKKHV